ncbi:MAG: hypothetical protein ACPG19_14275 [Saprospiraceae bacterium]
MQENKFLKWLPSIFILIGVGLWVNSLCFSIVTNDYENDLVEDWRVNLEEGNLIMDSSNAQIQLGVEAAIIKRPDDKNILELINQIIRLKEAAFQLLDKHLEQSNTNTFSIITTFQKKTKELLYNSRDANPMIDEEEIKDVLSQQSFKKIDWSGDIELFINTQKQQLNSAVAVDLHFLSSKIGRMFCGWTPISPIVQFNSNALKKDDIAKGKIFLSENISNREMDIFNTKYTINGKEKAEIDGAVSLKKTFKNRTPQKIEVQYEYQTQFFNRRKIIINNDTIKEHFIIYPTQ